MKKGRTDMAEERFEANLLRMVAAEMHLSVCLTVSREMFGKGYFALAPAEKLAVDGTVLATVRDLYQTITPDLLTEKMTGQSIGFQNPPKNPPQTTDK